jgi:hypothetical protein
LWDYLVTKRAAANLGAKRAAIRAFDYVRKKVQDYQSEREAYQASPGRAKQIANLMRRDYRLSDIHHPIVRAKRAIDTFLRNVNRRWADNPERVVDPYATSFKEAKAEGFVGKLVNEAPKMQARRLGVLVGRAQSQHSREETAFRALVRLTTQYKIRDALFERLTRRQEKLEDLKKQLEIRVSIEEGAAASEEGQEKVVNRSNPEGAREELRIAKLDLAETEQRIADLKSLPDRLEMAVGHSMRVRVAMGKADRALEEAWKVVRDPYNGVQPDELDQYRLPEEVKDQLQRNIGDEVARRAYLNSRVEELSRLRRSDFPARLSAAIAYRQAQSELATLREVLRASDTRVAHAEKAFTIFNEREADLARKVGQPFVAEIPATGSPRAVESFDGLSRFQRMSITIARLESDQQLANVLRRRLDRIPKTGSENLHRIRTVEEQLSVINGRLAANQGRLEQVAMDYANSSPQGLRALGHNANTTFRDWDGDSLLLKWLPANSEARKKLHEEKLINGEQQQSQPQPEQQQQHGPPQQRQPQLEAKLHGQEPAIITPTSSERTATALHTGANALFGFALAEAGYRLYQGDPRAKADIGILMGGAVVPALTHPIVRRIAQGRGLEKAAAQLTAARAVPRVGAAVSAGFTVISVIETIRALREWHRTNKLLVDMPRSLPTAGPSDRAILEQTRQTLEAKRGDGALNTAIAAANTTLGVIGTRALLAGNGAVAVGSGALAAGITYGTAYMPQSLRSWLSHQLVSEDLSSQVGRSDSKAAEQVRQLRTRAAQTPAPIQPGLVLV